MKYLNFGCRYENWNGI